jgi:sarcosine oxidase subunit beta
MGDQAYDVIIVGGGIMGCWTAYRLAKAGRRVMLVERTEIAFEGSGRNRGNVRVQLRDPDEMEMARRSLELWPKAEAEFGTSMEFRRTGNLLVTYDRDIAEEFPQEAERHCAMGLDAHVVHGNRLRELVPGISGAVLSGLLTTDDGHINPQLATWAVATGAKRAGADIRRGVSVERIEVNRGKVAGVATSAGVFSAPQVLVAGGVWSGRLLEPAGLSLPIEPALHQCMATAKLPYVTGPYLRCASPRVGFCQTASGTLLLGMAPARKIRLGEEPRISREHLTRVMAETIRLVPNLEQVSAVRAWAGLFDMTPDDHPFIGPVEGTDGLFVAAGFCGHGFAISPVVTEVLSALMLGEEPSIDLTPFDPRRFEKPAAREPRARPVGRIAQLGNLTSPSL